MADKNTKKKDNNKEAEKMKVSSKVLIIIGAALAVIALALVLIFNDGMPKNVKTGIEAAVEQQLGCEVTSLKTAKKFRIKNSEYEKETIYLVKGVFKGAEFFDGYHAVILVAEIEVDGEERVICKPVKWYPEKEKAKELIKEMKKDPDSCSKMLKELNQNKYLKIW